MAELILYVKEGCPYCAAAEKELDRRKVKYVEKEVITDKAAFEKLREISGQTKTPTLQWGDEVLADFGVDQLDSFLARVRSAS